jgi:NAD(P)-dependent dehydrogenase (short-subunit alcohol dehydrogenase family)
LSIDRLDLKSLFNLEDKIALITGGSRGIGRMMAEGLLQAGASVYITARSADVCQQTAEELGAFGICKAIPADINDADQRQELVSRIRESEGKLDILINNAGTAWGDSYENYAVEAFDKVPARVINIGSMDGLHIPTVHGVGTYAYTASKAAVHHLTRHLAVELGPRHITVNAIAPGFFPSQMTDKIFEHFGEQIKRNSLLGRVGKPEDIAGLAVCLSSRAGAYIHGAVIPVDGGTIVNHRHA